MNLFEWLSRKSPLLADGSVQCAELHGSHRSKVLQVSAAVAVPAEGVQSPTQA